MAVKTTSFKYSLWGGQFEPDLPGQFAPDWGGQVRPDLGGHIERIFHLSDLHTMLKKHGDWMDLGSVDEQKPAKENTVESWGRSENNPVGGWYGLKKGLRGRFGMYIPPLMEKLGLAEVTHEAKGNRMKAK